MENRLLTVPNPALPEPIHGSNAPMRIAVAYHDTATLIKAVQFCDRLVQQHWEDIDIECTWWKFGLLGQQPILRDAVDAAAQADLIVFSLSADHELTEATHDWIDRWLERRHFKTGALVSLVPELPTNPGQPSAVEARLQEIASRGMLDFFPHHLTTLERPDNLIEDMEFKSGILDNLPDDDTMPRWGINE